MRRSAVVTIMAVVLAAAAGAPAAAAVPTSTAPGAPGTTADWTPADKHGFGTATGTTSKVWYTLEHGELTEVYYPDLGTPSLLGSGRWPGGP